MPQSAERAEVLKQLHADHPGWKFEYIDGRVVPWIAIRERDARWQGGYPVAEAKDPDELERLIGQSVEMEAKVAARSERCTR
ncbi:hypothetical protein OHR68_10050 [Spirillospora sp. NBC_00431]